VIWLLLYSDGCAAVNGDMAVSFLHLRCSKMASMGECPRCAEVPVKKILRDRRHHNTDVKDTQNITRSFPTMASSD